VINGASCNAHRTHGCPTAVRDLPVCSHPGGGLAINDRASTLYVALFFPFPRGPLVFIKIKN